MVHLLACDCADCKHWEVCKLPDNTIHLTCKTCGRRDELDSFVVHEKPGSQMRWVESENE